MCAIALLALPSCARFDSAASEPFTIEPDLGGAPSSPPPPPPPLPASEPVAAPAFVPPAEDKPRSASTTTPSV